MQISGREKRGEDMEQKNGSKRKDEGQTVF
jgi:hypothetical protein